MATPYTKNEWKAINNLLDSDPSKYGFPRRIYSTALVGSFNVRKLGSSRSRNAATWAFLARICKQFDLIAIQEIMEDLSGLNRIMELLGPEFGLVVSDKTGVFPGDGGLGERLGFIYRWSIVERGEVISDVTYDRTKVIQIIAEQYEEIKTVFEPYAEKYKDYKLGLRKKPRNIRLPAFISFIRQPYCVSFRIKGFPGTQPYEFMAVNAHLFFGDYMSDRRQEFHALMQWIIERVKNNDKAYYPNFMLLGDLNLDFNNPVNDRKTVEKSMKSYDKDGNDETNPAKKISVNFPFLDEHPGQEQVFRTNARMSETFDQIGLFFRDSSQQWPTYKDNDTMGATEAGADYGVFNFVNLFHDALNIDTPIDQMTKDEKAEFYSRFEHKVSDHMPLWLRLPLPED
jgi:endonuclease/exonuclease/phosphatase family metal-dependent hydrolase